VSLAAQTRRYQSVVCGRSCACVRVIDTPTTPRHTYVPPARALPRERRRESVAAVSGARARTRFAPHCCIPPLVVVFVVVGIRDIAIDEVERQRWPRCLTSSSSVIVAVVALSLFRESIGQVVSIRLLQQDFRWRWSGDDFRWWWRYCSVIIPRESRSRREIWQALEGKKVIIERETTAKAIDICGGSFRKKSRTAIRIGHQLIWKLSASFWTKIPPRRSQLSRMTRRWDEKRKEDAGRLG